MVYVLVRILRFIARNIKGLEGMKQISLLIENSIYPQHSTEGYIH